MKMLTSYRTSPQQNLWLDEIIVDNFAGGGGASTGIEMALGRPVDIAINHDPDAIAMHTINHPHTKHYCESVWDINPREVTNGQPVGLAWFSPDCKHFSKAKGATPVNKEIRGLAWVAMRWAATVKPRIIMLENVEEFKTWGPIINGKPCPARKGKTFQSFVKQLEQLGYQVEWQNLVASDFGAPTIRKRFFLIARCDGEPIVWPKPTHGNPAKLNFKKSGLKKWKTAADIIDWSLPSRSIFDRPIPIVENSLRRIANGIQKFVIDDPKPFIVRLGHQGFGGDGMQYSIDQPLTTITSKQEHYLITPFISRQFGKSIGHKLDAPLGTITCGGGGKSLLVSAFLIKYYGREEGGISLREPLHTITSKDRFALITVKGEQYRIDDILMRGLEPKELYPAQSFPKNYIFNRDPKGKPIPKYKQVARCGNSVPPVLSQVLVQANYWPQQIRKAA
jgi:DNA (cytosine-5)-methyltransferase 1